MPHYGEQIRVPSHTRIGHATTKGNTKKVHTFSFFIFRCISPSTIFFSSSEKLTFFASSKYFFLAFSTAFLNCPQNDNNGFDRKTKASLFLCYNTKASPIVHLQNFDSILFHFSCCSPSIHLRFVDLTEET